MIWTEPLRGRGDWLDAVLDDVQTAGAQRHASHPGRTGRTVRRPSPTRREPGHSGVPEPPLEPRPGYR